MIRVVLALCLSLLLACTSVVQAQARVEMAGATDQVLCGSAGATTVTLDRSGRPVTRRACDHCTAAGVVGILAAAPAWGTPDQLPTRPLTIATAPHQAQSPTLTPSARGPPSLA